MEIADQIILFLAVLIGDMFGNMFGGGGFLKQPALLLAGINPRIAIANDIAGAAASTLGYFALQTSKNNT